MREEETCWGENRRGIEVDKNDGITERMVDKRREEGRESNGEIEEVILVEKREKKRGMHCEKGWGKERVVLLLHIKGVSRKIERGKAKRGEGEDTHTHTQTHTHTHTHTSRRDTAV